NEISAFINSTGLNDILRMPLITESRESLNNLGDTATLVRTLQRELSTQFETRKKLLLRNMVNFLDKRSLAGRSTILAEGTGSFNLVWEDICKTLFHDARAVMPRPKWEFFPSELAWNIGADNRNIDSEQDDDAKEEDASGEYGQTSTRTLIPDVVNNEEKDDHSVLYILDAKYYMPTYKGAATGNSKNKAHITQQPDIGDLIKQYFYMMALQRGLQIGIGTPTTTRDAGDAVTIKGNAFILPAQRMPSEPDDERYLLVQRGRVSLDFMNANRFPGMPRYILLYEMDAEQALRIYLNGIASRETALAYLHGMFVEDTFGEEGTNRMQQRRIKP
ncbi:hypothetical protein BW13_11235, partial [Bifidobacterium sp. UTCIF-37]|uniref:LlaJI family restriction endonuclease n=1 Tax=Bifidobacterium sp. UTCIF-37 TaxID=1465259 RepID=UPI00112C43C3